jgi:hypothetical protein
MLCSEFVWCVRKWCSLRRLCNVEWDVSIAVMVISGWCNASGCIISTFGASRRSGNHNGLQSGQPIWTSPLWYWTVALQQRRFFMHTNKLHPTLTLQHGDIRIRWLTFRYDFTFLVLEGILRRDGVCFLRHEILSKDGEFLSYGFVVALWWRTANGGIYLLGL